MELQKLLLLRFVGFFLYLDDLFVVLELQFVGAGWMQHVLCS